MPLCQHYLSLRHPQLCCLSLYMQAFKFLHVHHEMTLLPVVPSSRGKHLNRNTTYSLGKNTTLLQRENIKKYRCCFPKELQGMQEKA